MAAPQAVHCWQHATACFHARAPGGQESAAGIVPDTAPHQQDALLGQQGRQPLALGPPAAQVEHGDRDLTGGEAQRCLLAPAIPASQLSPCCARRARRRRAAVSCRGPRIGPVTRLQKVGGRVQRVPHVHPGLDSVCAVMGQGWGGAGMQGCQQAGEQLETLHRKGAESGCAGTAAPCSQAGMVPTSSSRNGAMPTCGGGKGAGGGERDRKWRSCGRLAGGWHKRAWLLSCPTMHG